ncbi:MAG: hypothetical protein K2Q07_07470 [Burkholderiaceae bacterium]|nr:hypothetical protein [Burkholderiaceae bacterium]
MIDLFQPVIVALPGTQRVHQCGDSPQWAVGNEVHMEQLRAAARASADKRRLTAEEKRRRKTERMRRLRAGKKATSEQLAAAMAARIAALRAHGDRARSISGAISHARALERREPRAA